MKSTVGTTTHIRLFILNDLQHKKRPVAKYNEKSNVLHLQFALSLWILSQHLLFFPQSLMAHHHHRQTGSPVRDESTPTLPSTPRRAMKISATVAVSVIDVVTFFWAHNIRNLHHACLHKFTLIKWFWSQCNFINNKGFHCSITDFLAISNHKLLFLQTPPTIHSPSVFSVVLASSFFFWQQQSHSGTEGLYSFSTENCCGHTKLTCLPLTSVNE